MYMIVNTGQASQAMHHTDLCCDKQDIHAMSQKSYHARFNIVAAISATKAITQLIGGATGGLRYLKSVKYDDLER